MTANVSLRGTHAVVIGGSIGGLCAARALQSRYLRVTILEADVLPSKPQGRKGTPQAWHNHFLLAAGREAIESLFPGFTQRLLEHGGCEIDPGMQAANCLLNGWAPRSTTNMRMLFASRPMVELTIREFVASDPSIALIEGARVTELLSRRDAEGPMVTGVTYRDGDGQMQQLTADFVIDACGRGSQAAKWMQAFGQHVDEMTLDAKVSYSSRWYKWPTNDLPWYRFLTTFPDPNPNAPEPHQYLCSVFPIENDSFIAVMGSWGLDMPTNVEAYEAAARRTRTREFSRLLDASDPLTGVHHTRSTRNIWRRFDRLEAPPRNFVAIGDAVCAFNPIYAQGMSCAATAALIVRHLLEAMDPGSPEFPKAFYGEQAKFLKGAWTLALSRDCGYERASGTEALPEGLRKRLLRKSTWQVFHFVSQACWADETVQTHFDRVYNLQESVYDLAKNPRVLAGLLRYGVKSLLGLSKIPPATAPELPPPDTDYTALRDAVMGQSLVRQ
jgi:2-polyprenyl-6-methoxyphenol hydroxylase-like FAD-dependent oxidoreductase